MSEIQPLSEAELAELERLYAAATQGEWWDDTYNSVFVGKGEEYKIIFSIPDHPKGDSYETEQSVERGAWYKESAQNKDHILAMHNAFPRLLATIRHEREKSNAERIREEVTRIEGSEPSGDCKLVEGGPLYSCSINLDDLRTPAQIRMHERERCAMIAETWRDWTEHKGWDSEEYTPEEIAAKIRSGL